MNIVLQQRIFAFSSNYEIETPACVYSAQKRFFFRWHRIKLLGPRSNLLATIRGRFFFRPKYDITLADGRAYRFWCEKFWKGVFACENGNEAFRVYQHKKLNYSIFQGASQIAAFSKNRVKVAGKDRYEIRVNDDVNPVLIISMALVIDCGEIEDTAGTMTVDLGSLGPEERPFDARWQPS